MGTKNELDVFQQPESVAVIGATERPGSWGSFIMNGLLGEDFPGKIYPVNRHAEKVYGLPAHKDVRDIEGPVELAVFTIPEEFVVEAIKACGEKGVRGIIMITAGFAETSEQGKGRQREMTSLARSYGIRLVGPNVSGTFNLHAGFCAAAPGGARIHPTALAATCQGGFAFYDLLASAYSRGMGVGRFVHTGNECDLTVTDFLEHFGRDPEVKGVIMYLETIRDGWRFVEAAREVTRKKPVVVYKGGRTSGSARAAASHTGALSGRKELFEGLLNQAGVVISPTMEVLIPIAHALIERPPMKGRRVCIVTMGGSWGVALSDTLEEAGLEVTELSPGLQKTLRALEIPERASMKNPVDMGASGLFFKTDLMVDVGRKVLNSGEVDALILHGVGRSGMNDENTPDERKFFTRVESEIIRRYHALEAETGVPVVIASNFTPWESQAIWDATEEGIRVPDSLYGIAHLLYALYDHWRKGPGGRRGREG